MKPITMTVTDVAWELQTTETNTRKLDQQWHDPPSAGWRIDQDPSL